MKNSMIKGVLAAFNEKPIAFQPIYSEILGTDLVGGVLLSQVVYWWYAMGANEYYKTDEDFSNEIKCGIAELRNAKKRLVKSELIEIRLKGVPAKTHYWLNEDKLIELVSSLHNLHKLDYTNCTNQFDEIVQTSLPKNNKLYTENTQRTPENTYKAEHEVQLESENEQNFPKQTEQSFSESGLSAPPLPPQPVPDTQNSPEPAFGGRIKLSSIETAKSSTRASYNLTDPDELAILNIYKSLVFNKATHKTQSAIENIPKIIKHAESISQNRKQAIKDIINAITKFSEVDWWKKTLTEKPLLATPKMFLNIKFFIKNILDPYYASEQYGTVRQPDVSLEERKRIADEHNTKEFAKMREAMEKYGGHTS